MNKPVPSPRTPSAGAVSPFELKVRYYRVMRRRQVYPLVVESPRASAKPVAGQAPLIVKPIISGAIVAPAEQVLDPNPAECTLTFQVTPLAKGRMRDSRVEVLQHGRMVEKIPLRMGTTTQRLTWALLLLTIIVPSVLVYYTDIAPLTGEVPTLPPPRRQIPAGAPGPAPAAAPDASAPQPNTRMGRPGEVLRYRISHVIHENCPKPNDEYLNWLIKDKPNYVIESKPDDAVEWVACELGRAYQYLYRERQDPDVEFYPAFYCAVLLGALTVLSWFSHWTLRGSIRRTGIRLPDGASSGHARPFGSREEPATIVEAND